MNKSKGKACMCEVAANRSVLLKRLDAVLDEYVSKPGGLIPVLQIAQGIFGYLPEDVLKQICLRMNKSYSEVAGVVSFYSFFSTTKRGRYLVRVCMGTACYVRGGKQVLDAIKQHLKIDVGETTPDGKFTLETARCFGACGLAPVMMVNDVVHQRVKAARVQDILDQYRQGEKGKRAARKGWK
ncbi:MAG: NAD(P)H-dependent oxidoreductase subunit E [Lentisphaerae bacterium]|nr:NAD(P)H-dependent oxidoreductase subunit E [Lentisphaerota bacterium]